MSTARRRHRRGPSERRAGWRDGARTALRPMLSFAPSIAALSLVQALLVLAPRPVPAHVLNRFRSGSWALLPPLSIVLVVAAIALDSAFADFLTYLALVAVPPLAALALAAIVRGGRPALARAGVAPLAPGLGRAR